MCKLLQNMQLIRQFSKLDLWDARELMIVRLGASALTTCTTKPCKLIFQHLRQGILFNFCLYTRIFIVFILVIAHHHNSYTIKACICTCSSHSYTQSKIRNIKQNILLVCSRSQVIIQISNGNCVKIFIRNSTQNFNYCLLGWICYMYTKDVINYWH